jgi:hypothetical protein
VREAAFDVLIGMIKYECEAKYPAPDGMTWVDINADAMSTRLVVTGWGAYQDPNKYRWQDPFPVLRLVP